VECDVRGEQAKHSAKASGCLTTLGAERIDLERTRVVESPECVTHLRFRVKR
jgi:hypothetical protein